MRQPIHLGEVYNHALALQSNEIVKERIRKHLTDINDVITEDDIRNVGLIQPLVDASTIDEVSNQNAL